MTHQDKKIFCIDSDGCAINTMTFKHKVFMAPKAYDYFNFEGKIDHQKFINDWLHINLYTAMRGANRFETLVYMLDYFDYPADQINYLKAWTERADQLSMTSLREEMARVGEQVDLKAAYQWSKDCNEGIHHYESDDYAAFLGVRKALAEIAKYGPIYVVSTANAPNISAEWRENNLDEFVTEYRCQEAGPKRMTLAKLVQEGNDPEDIIMIGDSPGDLRAAEQTGIHFYPILVGQESESWENFIERTLGEFLRGEMTQEKYTDMFKKHLN